MKKALLLVALLLVFAMAMAQFDTNLVITEVSTFEVRGHFSIRNYGSEAIEWHFGDAQTFTLMVDGVSPPAAYPQIYTVVTIPAGATYTDILSYYDGNPLSPGVHIAQVYMGNDSSCLIGNPVEFWIPEPVCEYEELVFNLALMDQQKNYLTADLFMLNPGSDDWAFGFPFTDIVELRVDGVPQKSEYTSNTATFTIPSGEMEILQLAYIQSEAFAPGEHLLTAHLIIDGFPQVGETIAFVVEPTSNSDELNTPDFALTAYPNPFHGNLSLRLWNKCERPTVIRIYNSKGQKVRELRSDAMVEEETITWDGRDRSGRKVSPGVYLIRINTEKASLMKKVLRY